MTNWKKDAVQGQFHVFRSLTQSYYQINTRDHTLGEVFSVVQVTLKNHLLIDGKVCRTAKDIGVEIIKQMPQNEMDVKLSFVVIFTNQYVNGKQCKMPVFGIRFKNECIFIDTNCSVYRSWESYLKYSNVSHLEYIYPVEGYYDVERNLKVEIKKSTLWQSITHIVCRNMSIIVGTTVVIATCFFQHPTFRQIVDWLLPLAEKILPGIEKCVQKLTPLQTLAVKLKSGKMGWMEFICSAQKVIQQFHSEFQDEISQVWSTLTKLFWSKFEPVLRFFYDLYNKATSNTKRLFLATARQIRAAVIRGESDFDRAVTEAGEEHETARAEHVKMFDNCKYECALNIGVKEKTSDTDSVNVTKDIFAISDNIVKDLQYDNLNDAQDILKSVCEVMIEDYRQNLNTYAEFLKCAKKTTPDLDTKAFNRNLDIKEDENVKSHYWKITLKKFSDPAVNRLIKDKIKELKSQKKILLIPITESQQNSANHFYKCTGIPGGGIISSRDLLKALKEIPIQFDEKEMIINEIQTQVFIRSKELVITMTQEVDVDNTANGTVAILNIRSED